MRVLETRFSRLTLDDDGIVTARPTDTDELRSTKMMGEILAALGELIGSDRCPALWIPGEARLSPGGWQALIDQIGKLVLAVGILVDDITDHPLGAFPQTVDSLLLPVRLFSDEAEARQWLSQFIALPSVSSQSEPDLP